MKKNVLGALAAIFTCCLFLTSCGENGGSPADLLLGNWFMNQENEVDGDLILQYADDEEDDPLICHPFNPDDIELMAKLDKLVK